MHAIARLIVLQEIIIRRSDDLHLELSHVCGAKQYTASCEIMKENFMLIQY